MSGEDNFIARWSRLKRQAAENKEAQADAEAPGRERRDDDVGRGAKAADSPHPETEPPFDPASLPPVDSIVADSDIRAFLQKGIPADLTKAALRRAWSADPAIRDFIGFAENQWDFNDPTSVPGFGTLDHTVDFDKLVAQATGKLPHAPDAAAVPEEGRTAVMTDRTSEAAAPPAQDDGPTILDEKSPADATASQQAMPASDSSPAPGRKGHGRALPR
jgi:hypothetical protein